MTKNAYRWELSTKTPSNDVVNHPFPICKEAPVEEGDAVISLPSNSSHHGGWYRVEKRMLAWKRLDSLNQNHTKGVCLQVWAEVGDFLHLQDIGSDPSPFNAIPPKRMRILDIAPYCPTGEYAVGQVWLREGEPHLQGKEEWNSHTL